MVDYLIIFYYEMISYPFNLLDAFSFSHYLSELGVCVCVCVNVSQNERFSMLNKRQHLRRKCHIFYYISEK